MRSDFRVNNLFYHPVSYYSLGNLHNHDGKDNHVVGFQMPALLIF